MKGIDLFCSSSASTAICVSSLDQRSMVRSHINCGASSSSTSRAIDRHNPHVRSDGSRGRRRRRRSRSRSSSALITTSTNSSSEPIIIDPATNKPKQVHKYHPNHHRHLQKSSTSKKSSSAAYKPTTSTDEDDLIISPTCSSSRYLLSDTSNTIPFFHVLSDQVDSVSALVPLEPSSRSRSLAPLKSSSRSRALAPFELSSLSSPSSSSRSRALVPLEPLSRSRSVVNYSSSDASHPALLPPPCASTGRSPDQVVVLRVSLHCKGCEAKVRKHVSRMEGVTSFSIDFMSKKVTVVGDVTPLGVLTSVSRVKNAQFWPSSSSTSAATPSTY